MAPLAASSGGGGGRCGGVWHARQTTDELSSGTLLRDVSQEHKKGVFKKNYERINVLRDVCEVEWKERNTCGGGGGGWGCSDSFPIEMPVKLRRPTHTSGNTPAS